MKRDMELVRSILLVIERGESGFAPQEIKIDEYTDAQVGYHVFIMIEAGLLDGADLTSRHGTGPVGSARRMTWAGHEFLDAARDEPRWKKAMAIVKEKGGSVTIGVLTQLLTGLMKQGLGLS